MNILGFDTSASACSIGIVIGDKIEVLHQIAPQKQDKIILPLIDELLNKVHLSLIDLDAIAFGAGPGSFTGMRIASSVAQAIGFAQNLPIIPVSSLAVLAQTAYEQYGYTNVWVAVDARMKQIYGANYQLSHRSLMQLCGKEFVCEPDRITIPLDKDWYGVGDGWGVLPNETLTLFPRSPLAMKIDILPHASALLALAKAKFELGEWVSPAQALPSYLR